MNVVTRAIVVGSTALAAYAEGVLATPYFPPQTIWIVIAIAAAFVVAGDRVRFIALPVVLSVMYLLPAMMIAWVGNENFSIEYVYLLPLLGLACSGRGASRWSLPGPWQWPLITWAMIVSLSWPIVFMREADFRFWLLWTTTANTSIGPSPGEVNQHVTYLALIHNLGILWIDALCRWYRSDRLRFTREVVYPLAITAAIGSAVAIYQGLIDLTFLNRGFWTYMLRAAGTHGDPNKLGAVVAFWTLGTVVLARRFAPPWQSIVSVAAIMIGIAAVWTSGSRTGLAAIIVSVAIGAFETVRAWRFDRRRLVRFGAGAAVAAVVLGVVLQNASTHTVVQRGTLGYLPFFGDRGIVNSANELLWERNGFGPAAIEMITQHPIDGVGVGMFHSLAHDFGKLRGYDIRSDNAQNWFRHVVAELGILGAIPIFWWCMVFASLMFSRAGPRSDQLSVGLLRGVLLGFVVASMFGVPGQTAAVAITFWVFVFWFLLERADEVSAVRHSWTRPAAIAAGIIIALQVTMTGADARGDLRPRHRAERFDWFYRYGIGELEPDPGGNPVQRRWAGQEALVVIPVKGKVLKFVAWIDHPDGDANPPHVTVRADARVVYDGPLKRSAPLFIDIPAAPGKTHMVLETSIDRVYRPVDQGGTDRRRLGVSIRDFVWE
jgi:O-antigen ligase